MFSFSINRVLQDFLSAEQYQKSCDTIWSTDRRASIVCDRTPSRPGQIIYAKSDHSQGLFAHLRRTRSKVILVTAESDDLISPDVAKNRPSQVAAWFSTNATAAGVQPIPLGLGNSYCPVTNKAPALAEAARPFQQRSKLLYVNFRAETNPAERAPLLSSFSQMSGEWLTVRQGGLEPAAFLSEMAGHQFVLCPPGNGIDTHRMWEAMYTRTIPVVQRHPALRDFADLPILFVDDLLSVNESFLRAELARMQGREWNEEKLFLPWWSERIKAAAVSLAASNKIPVWDFLRERLAR